MKIAILGNCQSRPLADLLRRSCPGATVLDPLIVHLLREDDRASALAAFSAADLVLTQSIADAYPIDFARTSALRHAFGQRVVVWPNLFFSGQCPDLVSLSRTDGSRLVGPLETYQSAAVLDAWRCGKSLSDTLRLMEQDLPFPESTIDGVVDASLAALKQRDGSVDVPISDVIEDRFREQRLFFTYNHPTAALLATLSDRIVAHCGLGRAGASSDVVDAPEPLGRIVAPTTGPMATHVGLRYAIDDGCLGVDIDILPESVVTGASRHYALADLLELSFRAFDVQLHPDDRLNTTPAYLAPLLDRPVASACTDAQRRAA